MRIFILCFCFLLLGGCSQFSPFIDARREAGQVATVGSSRPDRPVVCSSFFTEAEKRLALAQTECDKKGEIAVSQEVHSFDCKLLTPVKEIFACVPKE